MNGDMGSNLAGELISEMQRTNPPAVFNPDAGAPMGMGGGPMGMGGSPMGGDPMAGGPMGGGAGGAGGANNGQGTVQINPQLQQQFLFVLQQDQQIQQKFADPQVLQQALQDPNVMMNTIAYFQQQLQARQPVQTQPQAPIAAPAETEDEADDDDDEDDDEKVQYDEKIDDIDLMSSKNSWVDKLVHNLKEPLLLTILFVILLQPMIKDYLVKMIPKIQDSPWLQMLALATIFLIGSFLLKIGMSLIN